MVLLSLINEFIFNNALNNKIIIKEYKQENNVKILSMKDDAKVIKYSGLALMKNTYALMKRILQH
nr:hypothetical protein [Mycoplasmopsis bovis]